MDDYMDAEKFKLGLRSILTNIENTLRQEKVEDGELEAGENPGAHSTDTEGGRKREEELVGHGLYDVKDYLRLQENVFVAPFY